MIAWLIDLRLTPEQCVGVVLLVAVVIGGIWQMQYELRHPDETLFRVPPRTVVTFPPQPTAYLRDIAHDQDEATDPLYDVTLAGYIRRLGPDGQLLWYNARMFEALACVIRSGGDDAGDERRLRYYAQMAAHSAFALHPDLREGPPLIQSAVDHGRRHGWLRAVSGERVH